MTLDKINSHNHTHHVIIMIASDNHREAVICQNCGPLNQLESAQRGGGIRLIGSKECACGDGDFRVVSADTEVLTEIKSNEQ